jgi:hypothetical protein
MPKPVQIGTATVLRGDCVALMPTVGMVDVGIGPTLGPLGE